MSKFEKILMISAIILNVIAGLFSFIAKDWTLGINELLLALFMYFYYECRVKEHI